MKQPAKVSQSNGTAVKVNLAAQFNKNRQCFQPEPPEDSHDTSLEAIPEDPSNGATTSTAAAVVRAIFQLSTSNISTPVSSNFRMVSLQPPLQMLLQQGMP